MELGFWIVVGLYTAASVLGLWFLARGGDAERRSAVFMLSTAALVHLAHLAIGIFQTGTFEPTGIREALNLAALVISMVYLVSLRARRLEVLGAFIAPVALAFLLASRFAGIAEQMQGPARSIMLSIHIGVNSLGIAAFALAFGVSLAYLIQESLLRQKKVDGVFQRLPALDVLDIWGVRLVALGFPLLTLGILSGAFWVIPGKQGLLEVSITQSLAFVSWLLFALILLLRALAGWQGRKAAIGTVLGFGSALLVLAGYVLR